MQISVHAEVRCTDGVFGRSTYVLVNPVTEKVTHVVVKGSGSAYMEYLVSVGAVMEATTGAYLYWPYFVIPETTVRMPVEHQQIPPGELAVRRGTGVEATDSYVGSVDEFLVNPDNDNITHLVIRDLPQLGDRQTPHRLDGASALGSYDEIGDEHAARKLRFVRPSHHVCSRPLLAARGFAAPLQI